MAEEKKKKEGSCGDCQGEGCYPPQKADCPANTLFPISEELKKTISA